MTGTVARDGHEFVHSPVLRINSCLMDIPFKLFSCDSTSRSALVRPSLVCFVSFQMQSMQNLQNVQNMKNVQNMQLSLIHI